MLMTKLIKLIYIPLFLVTCLVCHSVFAKSNDYQIELIVFDTQTQKIIAWIK